MRRLLYATPLAIALLVAPRAGAQATTCTDGSTTSATGRGACSGHGGINKAATRAVTKAQKKEVKAEQKAAVKEAKATGDQVACADGSMSAAGRGACSHHGGVRVAGAATVPTAHESTLPASVPANAPARHESRAEPHAAAAVASGHADDNDPTGAIAECKDGLYSHATNRRGACSRHHGVAKWLQ